MPLQLPAAQALSAAVLRELMQHSIVRLNGALLPVLVRLPAAEQLQDTDVAVLLHAALGRPCAAHSSSIGTTVAHAVPSTAGVSQLGRQQETQQQHESSLAHFTHSQHQPITATQGSLARRTSLPLLLQECLQCSIATAHLFQLLTLP